MILTVDISNVILAFKILCECHRNADLIHHKFKFDQLVENQTNPPVTFSGYSHRIWSLILINGIAGMKNSQGYPIPHQSNCRGFHQRYILIVLVMLFSNVTEDMSNSVHFVLQEPYRFRDLYRSLGLNNASKRNKKILGHVVDMLTALGADGDNFNGLNIEMYRLDYLDNVFYESLRNAVWNAYHANNQSQPYILVREVQENMTSLILRCGDGALQQLYFAKFPDRLPAPQAFVLPNVQPIEELDVPLAMAMNNHNPGDQEEMDEGPSHMNEDSGNFDEETSSVISEETKALSDSGSNMTMPSSFELVAAPSSFARMASTTMLLIG
jgi:hypothetical protein